MDLRATRVADDGAAVLARVCAGTFVDPDDGRPIAAPPVRVTIARGQSLHDEIADRVILALPFTLLREVDTAGAGFSARKTKAIRNRHLSPAPHWRSPSPAGVFRHRPLPRCA